MATAVQVLHLDSSEIEINDKEALRYLGYKNAHIEGEVEKLFYEAKKELISVVDYKCVYTTTHVKIDGDVVDFGFFKAESKALAKNLCRAENVVIFAATLGARVDRLIMKYSLLSPSKAVIADALASSAIECFADEIERRTVANMPTSPRFSAGYGDFKLECQEDLLNYLDSSSKIGLSLNSALLMTPTKSVSAIVGIGGQTEKETKNKCALCENKACKYSG